MAGPRNGSGFNDTTDCYRTIKGERYVGWVVCPTDARIGAYRGAGVLCRRIGDELFVRQADGEIAKEIDAKVGADF